MHKSVFSDFFSLCAAIISCAIVCVAVVLLVVSSEFYKSERKSYILDNIDDVMSATQLSIASSGSVDADFLEDVYLTATDTTEIVFTLTDSDGVALVCSEAPPCSHTGRKIGEDTLKKITESGFYELSSLDHFYESTLFNVAYKFYQDGNAYYIFAGLSDEPLKAYLSRLITVVAAATVIILGAVFVALYAIIKRFMIPIREMTFAAKRFGEGDFSKKVYVPEQNEFGFLANSLNEMAVSLEAQEESRKSFVSNVSHELKTPMTTIGGFVDGILDGTIPPSKHKYYLHIVSDEVDRLSRLVRSMLNISKYEAGEMQLSTENFDLMPILVKTVLIFEQRIDEKQVEIRGIDHGRFMLNADPDLTKQVIYNLVENAVKFVDKGGYIAFDFDTSPDGMSIVRIRNSGEGLKANEICKVFDRFYKTDASRGIDKTGVGLGLSIVSSIIKLHGGEILVRSEPNEYVEFEFTLKTGEREIPPDK
ncbi:MAG: HAMP domain-containing histidine kinase [Oscillospiraceae bacterium]|nr:HAMP domain-containing histidine kinase [Oscillospiraceae bacterium]